MISVGIRQFKSRLSEYIRLARAGEEIEVTDRGEPVVNVISSKLHPAQPDDDETALARLEARGLLTRGKPNRPDLYPSFSSGLPEGLAKRLLDEGREDR